MCTIGHFSSVSTVCSRFFTNSSSIHGVFIYICVCVFHLSRDIWCFCAQVGACDNVSTRIPKYCTTDDIIALGKENEVGRAHVDCVPTTHCKAYQMECRQLATTDQSPVSLKKPTATSVRSSQRHRTTHGILQKVANKELLPTTSDLRCDDAAKSLCPIGFSATNSDQSMINPQCFSELDTCPISSIVRQSVRKKLDIDDGMMMWAPPDSSYFSIIEHAPPGTVFYRLHTLLTYS